VAGIPRALDRVHETRHLRFLDSVPNRPATKRLIEQLADASGSIGGNREEALGGSSRKEFIRFNEIALRGANETEALPPLTFAL